MGRGRARREGKPEKERKERGNDEGGGVDGVKTKVADVHC